MLSLQGNTKQQATLSATSLSLSSDLHTKTWRSVFLLDKCVPMEYWRCAYGRRVAAVLRTSISAQRSTAVLRPRASRYRSVVSLAAGINSHSPDTAQQLHVQEESFPPFLPCSLATLLTTCSPLGHLESSDVVEWTLCTTHKSTCPDMHTWIPGYTCNCF